MPHPIRFSTLWLLASGIAAPALAVDPDLCAPAPRTGCFQSGEVELRIHREPGKPRKDALIWSWRNGAEVALADLGDPTSSTDYAVCLYDGDATAQTELAAPAPGTDSLRVGLDAPSGSARRRRNMWFWRAATGSRGASSGHSVAIAVSAVVMRPRRSTNKASRRRCRAPSGVRSSPPAPVTRSGPSTSTRTTSCKAVPTVPCSSRAIRLQHPRGENGG